MVDSVKHIYSLWLFLENFLENWELKNCKGIQESYHIGCLYKGVECKVRVREVCGCMNMLL